MKTTKPNISNQIPIETSNDACDKNYQAIMLKYYQLQFGSIHNAYNSFKDIDKDIILAYLINKTLSTYNKHFYNLSFEDFYSNKSVDIEKISISDLVKEIKLSKETARRKLNEMTKDGIITRNKKKITIQNYLKDHRVFMTSAIAALSFGGEWHIHDKDSIKTSFPTFLKTINKLKYET